MQGGEGGAAKAPPPQGGLAHAGKRKRGPDPALAAAQLESGHDPQGNAYRVLYKSADNIYSVNLTPQRGGRSRQVGQVSLASTRGNHFTAVTVCNALVQELASGALAQDNIYPRRDELSRQHGFDTQNSKSAKRAHASDPEGEVGRDDARDKGPADPAEFDLAQYQDTINLED